MNHENTSADGSKLVSAIWFRLSEGAARDISEKGL
jgi:hypothetical protein